MLGTIRKNLLVYYFFNSGKKNFCLVAKLCPTLCNAMGHSPPGSSVHRISQASILKWGAISSSRGSSQSKDQTCVSRTGRWSLYH